MKLPELVVSLYALLAVQTQPGQVQAFTPSPNSPALQTLASKEYSLANRYKVDSVNQVFADNILLTLSYLSGQTTIGDTINWDRVRQPSEYYFMLKPGESFAFHDQLLEQYKDSVVKTTNAHFILDEGFKSDGWLVGDGVCHLASFLHVVALEAGLEVTAPTRHDFAAIPEVPKEFGTSIYYMPNDVQLSSKQNLYIKNTTNKPVAFVFTYHADKQLEIKIDTVN